MTNSRGQREKGPSSKTRRKKKEKLLKERRERLRARPKRPREKDPNDRTVRRDGPKVGRNDPCPCGSNQKYKRCCYLGPDAALSVEKFLKKLGESKYAKSTN
jgi:hypothetical protein